MGTRTTCCVLLLLALVAAVVRAQDDTSYLHHERALQDPPYTTLWFSRACEDQNLVLRCEANRIIKLTGMFYGRINQNACTFDDKNTSATDCDAGTDLPWADVIRNACEDEESCSIPVTTETLTPDVCPGIYKLVEVEYECELRAYSELVCEDGEMELSCPENTIIHVYAGFYGREDTETCYTIADNAETPDQCASPDDIANKVAAICNGLNDCTVRVNNQYLSDPCPGTSKYLSVNYVCEACENKHDSDEACSRWADSDECQANPGWMNTRCTQSCWNCDAGDASCDNEEPGDCRWWTSRGECQLNPDWMSKNCPRSCRTCHLLEEEEEEEEEEQGFVGEEDVDYTAQVCEGNWVRANCGDSDLVLELTDVFFGRLDNTTCNDDSSVTTDCPAPADMLETARTLCDGRQSCFLGADNWQWGDPCPGTHKYLTLEHQCRKCEDELQAETCASLAAAGECDNNADDMREQCFATCTGCSYAECPNVVGSDSSCDRWAGAGECDNNSIYMLEFCKKSCRVCSNDPDVDDTCINKAGSGNCEDWAEDEECEKNPFWMADNCQKACDKCDRDDCENRHINCAYWASIGECTKNPNYMLTSCRQACEDCQNLGGQCVNAMGSDYLCNQWSAAGYCTTNAVYMDVSCAKACNLC